MKPTIICRIINKKRNEELLKNVPHREFLDLVVTYHICTEIYPERIDSIAITNSIADKMRLTEEELFFLALNGTRKLMPFTIESIEETLKNSHSCEVDIAPLLFSVPDEEMPRVITTPQRAYGATVLLYADILKKIADELDDNLYMVPSSIHEIIVHAVSYSSLPFLKPVIWELNQTEVSADEFLSNNVYYFDRTTNTITICE